MQSKNLKLPRKLGKREEELLAIAEKHGYFIIKRSPEGGLLEYLVLKAANKLIARGIAELVKEEVVKEQQQLIFKVTHKHVAELRFGFFDISKYQVIAQAQGYTPDDAIANLKQAAQQRSALNAISDRYTQLLDESGRSLNFEQFWKLLTTMSQCTECDKVVTYLTDDAVDCPDVYQHCCPQERDGDREITVYWVPPF